MTDLLDLPLRSPDGGYHGVIESPAGSPVKLAYRPALAAMALTRRLPHGLVFPFNWGFIAATRAADGDPLDLLLLGDAPLPPATVVEVQPIGIVLVTQRARTGDHRESNHRIIATCDDDSPYAGLERAGDLPAALRQQIELFFASSVHFEEKDLRIGGWGDRGEAVDEITRAATAFASQRTRIR